MKRYFMLISEACLLVMQSGAVGKGGEVFVLDMGSPVKIIDLAKELIRRSGFDSDQIKIEYSEPRPGEKLSEEILTAEEGTTATKNQKIFIAKISPVNRENMVSSMAGLEKAINDSDKGAIISALKKLIPFYNPSSHVLNNK
jgi:FlaA1/EpsC-like NDP-sugar epimerase